MYKIGYLYKSMNKFSKDCSPKIKITEKSIEGFNKKRNMSLDFSNSPLKQNKKIIQRNTRTNSLNSHFLNQTDNVMTQNYPFISGMPSTNNFQYKLMLKKNLTGFKYQNKSKNKTLNLNKGFFNLSKSKVPHRKKNYKKMSKEPRLQNSYYINPSNIHINFSTVGNNIKMEQYTKKTKSTKKINKFDITTQDSDSKNNSLNKYYKKTNNNSNSDYNLFKDFKQIIQSSSYEQQILLLNEFKLFYNILPKIKNVKNSLENLQFLETEGCGIIGELIRENMILKKNNEELLNTVNSLQKGYDEVKNNNLNLKEELEENNKLLRDMKTQMIIFNKELNKLQNMKNENNNNFLSNNNNKIAKNSNKLFGETGINNNRGSSKKIELKELSLQNLNTNLFNQSKNKFKESDTNEITPSTGQGLDKLLNEEQKMKDENSSHNSCNTEDLENISLADNLNINELAYKSALNNFHNKNNKTNNKVELPKKKIENKEKKVIGNLDFNTKVGTDDFNEEFLKDYNNFSESWRKEVDKMLQRRGIKVNNTDGNKVNSNNTLAK